MAPPTEKDNSQADINFLLQVIAHTEELKVNWKAVAAATGITAYNNANRKFHVLVEKKGMKYKDGKITTKEEAVEHGDESMKGSRKRAAVKTEAKDAEEEDDKDVLTETPAKKAKVTKAKATPTPKKRKIEQAIKNEPKLGGESGADELGAAGVGDEDEGIIKTETE